MYIAARILRFSDGYTYQLSSQERKDRSDHARPNSEEPTKRAVGLVLFERTWVVPVLKASRTVIPATCSEDDAQDE